jgi:hypothetical protein
MTLNASETLLFCTASLLGVKLVHGLTANSTFLILRTTIKQLIGTPHCFGIQHRRFSEPQIELQQALRPVTEQLFGAVVSVKFPVSVLYPAQDHQHQ